MVGSYTMILHYSIGSLLNKKASLDLNLDGEKDTEMTDFILIFVEIMIITVHVDLKIVCFI